MDYFQGVVAEYLSADRAKFMNPECCIQPSPGDSPKASGPHWYCDLVAISLRESMPEPRVTSLESVTPWRVRSRHRLPPNEVDEERSR